MQQWVLVLHIRHIVESSSHILRGDPGSVGPQGLHQVWFSGSFLVHSQEHLIMFWEEAEKKSLLQPCCAYNKMCRWHMIGNMCKYVHNVTVCILRTYLIQHLLKSHPALFV